MGRNDQVSRILAVISKIQSTKAGVTVGALAKEFDVHSKTIRRDLQALEDAGFPLFDQEHEGRPHWKFTDGFMRFEVPFNAGELMSLYFFKDFLKLLEGTGFEKPFRELIAKVESHLPEEAKAFCRIAGQAVHMRVGPHVNYKSNRAVFDCVNAAIHKRLVLRMRYSSLSSKRTAIRDVQPYSLYYFDGAVYLVGWDSLRDKICTFNLERIHMAELTAKTFTLPRDFDSATYFDSSYGIFNQDKVTVEILFDAGVSPFILERQWHASQKIKRQPDGRLKLTLTVGGTREVKAWVMGFCEHAEVVAPSELREEIRRDLESMRRMYMATKMEQTLADNAVPAKEEAG